VVQAAAMFVATNIDDLVVLMVFFGRARGDRAATVRVVGGQYLGFVAILLVSIVGAFGVRLLPATAVAYFGLLPIVFGIAADVTNVRSSAFMVMYAVLAGVMIWTWFAARNERRAILDKEPRLREQMVEGHLLDARPSGGRWLTNWRPDDEGFWVTTGRRIALRNLAFSMPALFLAFAVWMVWSVVVIELPKVGFQFTTSELFWLAALPGLSGAAMRLGYAFMVPIFGGRNFTVFSTVSLLLPAFWMAFAVQDPHTNYAVFAVIALLCGLGGGNSAAWCDGRNGLAVHCRQSRTPTRRAAFCTSACTRSEYDLRVLRRHRGHLRHDRDPAEDGNRRPAIPRRTCRRRRRRTELETRDSRGL